MFGSATTRIRTAVRDFASGFDAATLEVDEAKRLVLEWAAIKNSAAAIESLAAARVATAGQWDRSDGNSAADWLAGQTGTTAARAREQIETGQKLRDLDDTAAAAKAGELSAEQAAAIADAAVVNAAAEAALLATARSGSLRDLRDHCAVVKAHADADPEATQRRIHAGRRVRRWVRRRRWGLRNSSKKCGSILVLRY
jgi:soluble cytochrome b562